MRLVLIVALLLPLAAQAELDETERAVVVAGLGGAVATYAAVNTIFMLDQLLKQGWSEPKHTVPAGFLAGASLVASVAGLAWWVQNRDEIGIVGGAMAAMSSAAMCLLVTLAIHGWSIRQPQSAVNDAFTR